MANLGSVREYYRLWNPSSSKNAAAINGGNTGSNARDAGGYSSSHIRATLVGSNAKTNETYAGDVNLDSSNCLYSCIESELQNVITAKKIKYVTGRSSSYSLNSDIADEIWLFSAREVCGTGEYSGGVAEGIGSSGNAYSKFINTNSKYYISSYNNSPNDVRSTYSDYLNWSYSWKLRSISVGRKLYRVFDWPWTGYL